MRGLGRDLARMLKSAVAAVAFLCLSCFLLGTVVSRPIHAVHMVPQPRYQCDGDLPPMQYYSKCDECRRLVDVTPVEEK